MEVNWYFIILSFAVIAAILIFMHKQHQKAELESKKKLIEREKKSNSTEHDTK